MGSLNTRGDLWKGEGLRVGQGDVGWGRVESQAAFKGAVQIGLKFASEKGL